MCGGSRIVILVALLLGCYSKLEVRVNYAPLISVRRVKVIQPSSNCA